MMMNIDARVLTARAVWRGVTSRVLGITSVNSNIILDLFSRRFKGQGKEATVVSVL